mmetsp:Transcript_13709/g.34525  ORF Transcript_13709/g.34525 Transcript_13709/m.34525 type:complete len:226 (-) Transcript_13709:1555-2232(-)
MCHHSLPSLLEPIMSSVPTEKLVLRQISKPVAWALGCCLAFYLLLNITVNLRWSDADIEDVITLNFQNFKSRIVPIFLELFPVCTLGASFPIIACTFRNNMQSLVVARQQTQQSPGSQSLNIVRDVVIPVLVLVLPLTIAFLTQGVELLVSITGSYGGCAIEFVIPTLLVMAARRKVAQLQENKTYFKKMQLGVLSSRYLEMLVLAWASVCLILVTMHNLSHSKG